VGRAEASVPASSDSDAAAAALSAAAVMFPIGDTQTPRCGGGGAIPAQRPGDAELHSSGINEAVAAAGPAVVWRDDDLWRASARLPRLVVRNTEVGGEDSPMVMGPSQLSPDHDAPVRVHSRHTAPSCVPYAADRDWAASS